MNLYDLPEFIILKIFRYVHYHNQICINYDIIYFQDYVYYNMPIYCYRNLFNNSRCIKNTPRCIKNRFMHTIPIICPIIDEWVVAKQEIRNKKFSPFRDIEDED